MTNEAILKAFRLSLQNKKELKLINTYKGLPISFPALVLSVEGEAVKLKVDRSQMVCMYHTHSTFVQGEYFQEIIKGYVTQLDLIKLEAILSYYEVPRSSFNNRSQVRVEPGDPISGDIKIKELRVPFRGILADISLGGLGIYIEERLFVPNIYRPGAEIIVMINLPVTGKTVTRTTVSYSDPPNGSFDAQKTRIDLLSNVTRPLTSLSSATYNPDPGGVVELHGVIVKTTRETGQRRYRLGIKYTPSEVSRAMINQFITARQGEIINEIRAEYNNIIANQQKQK